MYQCYCDAANELHSIVFIHGLTGASDSTWLHHEAQTLWPASLLGSDIPDSRIITFGYDANVVNFWTPASQNGVEDHALSLLGGLTRLKEQSDSVSFEILISGNDRWPESGGVLVSDDA